MLPPTLLEAVLDLLKFLRVGLLQMLKPLSQLRLALMDRLAKRFRVLFL